MPSVRLRLPLLAVLLGLLFLMGGGAREAAGAVTVPAWGSFYTDKSSIQSNAGDESDPFHDMANDCNYNYPLPPNPNFFLVNYISVMEDGSVYGECRYTDQYFGVTERQNGSFTGSLNVQTGVFSAEVINTRTYDVSGDFPRKQTFSITLHIENGNVSSGFANGTATFEFSYSCTGSCSETDSYSGTINYSFAIRPANTVDLSIDHIEVVQVVQDANNGVPLVANKTTVVRIFPKANATVVGAKVRLLHGGEIVNEAPVDVSTPPVDREEASLSGNFEIPIELTTAGERTFSAEILPPEGFADTDEANNKGSTTVNFQSRQGLFVDYIKVCHRPGGAGEPNCPHGDVNSVHQYAQTIFPLGNEALIYNRIPGPVWMYEEPLATMEDEVRFLAALRKRFDFTETNRSLADQVVAWLPSGLPIEGGAADPRWDASIGGQGRVFYLQKKDGVNDLSLGIGFAHEIAHNLGRRHPDADGGCGAKDANNADWPYDDAKVHEPGFWIDGPLGTMIVPSSYNDLMSYCDNRWISDHTYKRLFAANFAPQSLSAQGETEFLIVSGSVGNGAGHLDPAYQVSMEGEAPASDPGGNTCVVFSGGSGGLGEFCFELTFVGGDEGVPISEEAFSLKVALPSGTTRVALEHEGTELDALEASGSAPTVDITSHTDGDTLEGEASLAWAATDGDGGEITYTLLYSADGGETWVPIAVDVTDPEFALDTAELEASTDGIFRVLASDGLNTSEATVGSLTVGTPVAWGDVNCSEAVDLGDAIGIARFTIGLLGNPPAGCPTMGLMNGEHAWGDVNCSGAVDLGDAIAIARFTIGIVATPPGCRAIGA